MPFNNEPRGGGKYINFKKGKLVNNGEEQGSIDGVMLVELDIKPDEYEGKPYQKVTLHLWDEQDERLYEMQFSLTSGYGFSFFAMLPHIDPDMSMDISGGLTKMESGHSSGKMFIRQGGKNLTWFYSKKNKKELDKIPKPKVAGHIGKGKDKKEVLDYTDRDEFIEKMLIAFQAKKLVKIYPKGAAEFKSRAKSPSANGKSNAYDATEPIDDLPF